MDGSRFDDLARSIAGAGGGRTSRRGLLGGLAGLAAGVLGIGRAGAITCPSGQYANAAGVCVCKTTGRQPDATGCPCAAGQTKCNGVCVSLSNDAANCGACGVSCPPPAAGTCTGQGICRSGSCYYPPLPAGTVCRQAAGQCDTAAVCDGVSQTCPPNGKKPNGTVCNDGNACTASDVCTNGVCTGTAVTCPVCQVCSGGACAAVASDPQCPSGCCNGKCCASGEQCVSGSCQPVCIPVQGKCDPADNQCCNGLCQDVRTCAGEGETQCCYSSGSPCLESCDCCDPNVCVGGMCCRNLDGLTCDDEQHPCCNGFQCLNGTCQLATCLHPGDFCDPDNNACCQDQPTDCEFLSGCGGAGLILPRCCHRNGGSCSADCECCPGMACQGGGCCVPEAALCGSSGECCAGLECRSGRCRPTCPLGGFACGATCCAARQHCVSGTCQCVELRGACNSDNNLCCQDEETLCPEFNAYGNADTCCRPQGGHCGSAADCCNEVYDTQWGRDSCGDDGICGGADAYCGVDEDCVGGRRCIGACFGPGIGLQFCSFSGGYPSCPAGTVCSQRRCIYPNELPG